MNNAVRLMMLSGVLGMVACAQPSAEEAAPQDASAIEAILEDVRVGPRVTSRGPSWTRRSG